MLNCGYRADLVVEEQVIVEIKSVNGIAPIHEAQLLSYRKLSDCKIGLLINFNVRMLKESIRRMDSEDCHSGVAAADSVDRRSS